MSKSIALLEKNELYNIRIERQTLIIYINQQLRNKEWSIYFGEIQAACQNKVFWGKAFNNISFDLSNCHWVDPCPLLSLLICLQEFKSKHNGKIFIRLPLYTENTASDFEKVLKFLATENFLYAFCKITDDIYDAGNIKVTPEGIEGLKQIDTELNYTNSSIVRCEIFNIKNILRDKDTFEDWLNEKLTEARINLSGNETENVINDLLYKLKIFLDETIQNIYYHAYTGLDYSSAGIYIRYRHGLKDKSIGIEERKRLKVTFEREEHACPRLDSSFAEVNNCFLEVFVVDNGIGIPASFSKSKDERIAFRNALNSIMRLGERGRTVQHRDLTDRGGLNLIYTILQQDRDYICGYSGGEWIGDNVPFEDVHTFEFFDTSKVDRVATQGLAWIARMSVNSNVGLDYSEWKEWDGSFKQNPILKAYYDNPLPDKDALAFDIKDLRFNKDFLITNYWNALRIKKNVEHKDAVVLLFAPKSITKKKVWEIINECLGNYSILRGTERRNLIIVDIPEKEALLYQAALNKSKIYGATNFWKDKVSSITLVSRRYFVSFLRKIIDPRRNLMIKAPDASFTFSNDINHAQEFLDSFTYPDAPSYSPGRTIRDLIALIKFYETQLFWYNLSRQKNRDNFFINREIVWGAKGEVINGYLNFASTLANKNFLQLYKITVERVYGFYKSKMCLFKEIDVLTKSLAEHFNSKIDIKGKNDYGKIFIGSVLGSGWQQKNSVITTEISKEDLIINFFVHPDSSYEEKRASIFFWPGARDLWEFFGSNDKNYQRIGKTYSIAEHGWKYFPIPRYNKSNQSFYKRRPSDAYNDWQSINNSIVSFGNHTYQDYSDLVKIDIKKAVEYGFKYRNHLAQFLVTELAFAFGALNEIDINPGYKNYIQGIEEAKRHDLNIREFYEDICLIVYPNHLNTSVVFENIREIFDDAIVAARILPLDFIRPNNESNALLISPLILDYIKRIISDRRRKIERLGTPSQKVNILFFDCTIVSGRTRKQIKHILFGLGADNVKTLVILDRNRLPFSLPNEDSLRAYWRLDLPRLAYGDQNPINYSINEIMTLGKLLVKPGLDRAVEWVEIWGRSPGNVNNLRHGIQPSRLLHHNKMIKKFGIDPQPPHQQIGGDSNLIHLVSSLGLSIYAAEALTMTGRDDVAIKFISSYSLGSSVEIELICSQLLLFPKEFSNELRYDLTRKLFYASLSIEEQDNYTALAAVVLMVQPKEVIKRLFDDILKIDSGLQKSLNLDLLLCIAYMINKYEFGEDFFYTRYDSILTKHNKDSLWDVYKRFHFDIYEGKGKLHSKPIIDLTSPGPKPMSLKLADSLISFSRIANIFSAEIKEWMFNRKHRDVNSSNIQEVMNRCYDRAENILFTNNKGAYFEFVEHVKNEIIPFLKLVHGSLFFIVKRADQSPLVKPFTEKLETILKYVMGKPELWKEEARSKKRERFFQEEPVVKFTTKFSDFPAKYNESSIIWVVFDKMVELEIENLFFNALYADEAICDPWNLQNKEVADLWIMVEYVEGSVKVRLKNVTELNETECYGIFKNNFKQEHRHCQSNKGLSCGYEIYVLPQTDNLNTLEVIFTLPIL